MSNRKRAQAQAQPVQVAALAKASQKSEGQRGYGPIIIQQLQGPQITSLELYRFYLFSSSLINRW